MEHESVQWGKSWGCPWTAHRPPCHCPCHPLCHTPCHTVLQSLSHCPPCQWQVWPHCPLCHTVILVTPLVVLHVTLVVALTATSPLCHIALLVILLATLLARLSSLSHMLLSLTKIHLWIFSPAPGAFTTLYASLPALRKREKIYFTTKTDICRSYSVVLQLWRATGTSHRNFFDLFTCRCFSMEKHLLAVICAYAIFLKCQFLCTIRGKSRCLGQRRSLPLLLFLAVQDSSITDIVCLSVPWSVWAN